MRTFTHDELHEIGKQTTNTLLNYYEEPDCEWNVVEKSVSEGFEIARSSV